MFAAILFGAHGVRGTDQYWYLADVTTLIAGQGPFSNLYFPRTIIEGREHANYFVHNGPLLYLSAIFGRLTGPFSGWLTINVLSHLITTICIYFVGRKYASTQTSVASAFLYLVSPVAVWQSLNMMQEQFYGAVLALTLLAFSYKDAVLARIFLQVMLVLCIGIHPLFTCIAIVYILVSLYQAKTSRNAPAIFGTIIFAVLCGVAWHFYGLMFPSTFQPNIVSIVKGSVPNVSSMVWHYSDVLPAMNIDFLYKKVAVALKSHIMQFPVYFYTNVALGITIYLLAAEWRKMRDIEWMLSFLLSLYVAMSVLMQTQPRYQQIFAPASFMLLAFGFERIRPYLTVTTKNFFFTSMSSGTVVIGIFLCHTANIQSKQEQYSLAEISREFSSLPGKSKIMLVDSEHETKLGYVLKPRSVLSVKTDLLEPDSYNQTISMFQPDYVVATDPQTLVPLPHRQMSVLQTEHLGSFYLYRLSTEGEIQFQSSLDSQ